MKRLNIKIYGIVQGVGFRPFMSRLADACRIRGTVCNKGPYVEVFAEGRDASLQQFVAGIPEQAPERAAILKVDVHDHQLHGLRPAADHPRGHAVRPRAHEHEGIPDVRGLPRGVRLAREPPLRCAARLLQRLRPRGLPAWP